MLKRGGFARFLHDLFSGSNRAFGFGLAHLGGGGAGFLDNHVSVNIGVGEDFVASCLCLGQLFLNFGVVSGGFSNGLPPLLQDVENWPVGEAAKEKGHDHKADYLGNKQTEIEPELLPCA